MGDRRTTIWLTLAGLIPCAFAWIAAAIPTRASTSVRPDALPPLAFEQYGVSYPEVRPYPVVEAHFDFQNRGNSAITIEEVEPSCGCLRWHLQGAKETYLPGETGSLVVRLFTANEKPGPHFYTLNVTSRGRDTQQEQLSFRVVLPERKVSIEPAEVYFYQLNGEPDSRTVFLTDYRSDRQAPLQVTGVESLSPQITTEVLPAETDDQGRRRIPVLLTVPGVVSSGRETTFVRLATNDPEFSHIAFPVLIEGPRNVYGPPVDEAAVVDIFEIIQSRYSTGDQDAIRR